MQDQRTVNRSTGYKEVALEYRRARAAELDQRKVGQKTGRIGCPMLAACRSMEAYGTKILKDTSKKAIKPWAEVLGISSLGLRVIGYLSGPWYKIPINFLLGRFKGDELNTGYVRSLKHGIRTGILGKGVFDQNELNLLVWAFIPELRGQQIDSTWVCSELSGEYYLDETMLDVVMQHNQTNAKRGAGQALGRLLSEFEMSELLLGPLSQSIDKDGRSIKMISVRDIHDFYKYGILPAHLEQQFKAAGMFSVYP